jgi:ATP-dependent Clp protease protease subunit
VETPDLTGVLDPEVKPVYLELLSAKLREQSAQAQLREIELERALDQEDDRKVKAGYIRHLNMNDIIMPPQTDAWIDMLEHWNRREPSKPITININSPGGSVLDGFAVYDTIARLQRGGTHVTVRGQGMVASMAAILLQVGDERVLDKSAFFMIHEISSGARGKLSELEDAQAFMKKLQDRALDILAEKSKLTKTQIARRWKRKDDYMTADEALKLGFVDRVE